VRELAGLAGLFLRLGATAFGGPAAHVAIMEEEVVRRRAWLSREEFLDLLGATNLIPGPNSTEMAMHVGRQRAGAAGLVVAGVSFILPAALATYAIAWVYVRFGALPSVQHILYGIKPVMIAVVAQALVVLARSAVKSWALGALGAAAVVAAALGIHELAVLFACGVVAAGPRLVGRPAVVFPLGAAAVAAPAAGLLPIFILFLKIGSVLFGSGYVLLAFLRADLVDRLHWLTEQQLLDAVAAGQITPGPVFSTATFIGYLLSGGPGAIVATLGIFLPAFVFVAASGPLIPRLRRSPIAGAFLDGVNVASLALMGLVAFQLGRSALVDVPTIGLAIASAALLLRFRLSSVWLVAAGAAVGLVRYL
jgi:chromate transporter